MSCSDPCLSGALRRVVVYVVQKPGAQPSRSNRICGVRLSRSLPCGAPKIPGEKTLPPGFLTPSAPSTLILVNKFTFLKTGSLSICIIIFVPSETVRIHAIYRSRSHPFTFFHSFFFHKTLPSVVESFF